jgi:hypothetical protein
MKRFLIQQGDVYYLTDGKLLRYDPKEAKTKDQKDGVEHVQREFKRIHDEPNTWYKAVEIKDSVFTAINTGP